MDSYVKTVPSTLHYVVKFKHDKHEIIVHREDDLSIHRDPYVPYIEAKKIYESYFYQAFQTMIADQFMEGMPIPRPHFSSTSIMVAKQMLQNGYDPGKGLGVWS